MKTGLDEAYYVTTTTRNRYFCFTGHEKTANDSVCCGGDVVCVIMGDYCKDFHCR
jgi:hypothetical protein